MAYPGSPAARLSESAGGTLPLLAYLALATLLMVGDHRGGFANQARQKLSVLAEPVWWLADAPGRLIDAGRELTSSRGSLLAENEQLRRELQVNASRLHRMAAVAEENQRLRELLGGTRGYRLTAQLAGIIDVVMQAAPTTHFVRLAQAVLYRGAGMSIVWPTLLALTGC